MGMLKEGVWLHAPLNAFSAIILFKAPAQDDFPQGKEKMVIQGRGKNTPALYKKK